MARKVTPEKIESMKRLRKEGLPYERIAIGLDLSVWTVKRHLKKVGLIERLKRKLGLR